MNRCSLNIDTRFIDDLEEEEPCSENGSKRYDEDWSRLVGCQDLRVGDTPLRATVFKLGSMTGSWAGRRTYRNGHVAAINQAAQDIDALIMDLEDFRQGYLVYFSRSFVQNKNFVVKKWFSSQFERLRTLNQTA
jgi:hypothetical protein